MKDTWEEEIKEFCDDLDCVQGIHTRETLKLFISELLAKQKKEIVEIVKAKNEFYENMHEENMPHNTMIAYHADSCIKAISEVIKEIEKL